ncbi:MAG: GntR family transcriptional regulator [Anaerolineales bacterium]
MNLLNENSTSALITVPLYIQIADGLISQIESGDLQPGTQLAPERDLSAELNVNRMTLRRALQVLQSQGLIIRKHGVGTFISETKIERQMETIFRFTSGMQNRGFTPGTKLIWVNTIEAEQKIAKDLAIPPHGRVYDILRLRSINQEPVMIESYKIPLTRFPGLEKFDLENRSIYEIIEVEFGVKIARNRQSFEPITATRFEADLLQVKVGSALMLENRLSYDAENQPIEFGKDRYRGDRFRFVTETPTFDISSIESHPAQQVVPI